MILPSQIVRDRNRGPNQSRYVHTNMGRRSRPTPIIGQRRRVIPVQGRPVVAAQLEGTNYYAMDGIFSSIGKAVKKVAKTTVKVLGGVAKIAIPVAAGVVVGKFAAPIISKGFKAVFKKGVPIVQPAPNPGIPLPSGSPATWDMGPVPSAPPIVYQPGAPSSSSGYYSGAAAPGASYDDAGQAVQPVPGQLPPWVLPVAIGGAAILAMGAMKRGRA